MGNLPIQEPWIFEWFASDANSYIVFSVTIVAGVIHPLLFILHLYRKFIKSSVVQNCTSDSSTNNGNDQSTTKNKSHRTYLSNERSITITHSKISTNSKFKRSNNNALAKHDQQILHLLKRIVDITTLTAIFFGWLATIFTFVNYLEVVSNPDTCQPMTILQNICWIFTKLCIYHVLIIRLQIAFWGSTHEYNRYLMFAAYCFVTIISLTCIIGSFIDVQSVHFTTGWCLFIIPTWIILLPCALDLICSIFALYLFMRPLKTMLNKIDLDHIDGNNKRNIHKNKLALNVAQLITKLILLSIIAVISNLFGGIFFAITDIALGSFIDTLINPVCLVLMEVKHKDLYKICCKYCHIGLHKMVHRKNKSIKSRPFGALLIVKKNDDNVSNAKDTKLQLPPNSTRMRCGTDTNTSSYIDEDGNKFGQVHTHSPAISAEIEMNLQSIKNLSMAQNGRPSVERVTSTSFYIDENTAVSPEPVSPDQMNTINNTPVPISPEMETPSTDSPNPETPESKEYNKSPERVDK